MSHAILGNKQREECVALILHKYNIQGMFHFWQQLAHSVKGVP